MRIFGCSKFKRLANEELDRALTPQEQAFIARHRSVCSECCEYVSQSTPALNFLRAAAIDIDVHPQFEERVIRKLRVQTTRESIRYWSPALAGACIAGLAVIAALQMITRSAELPHLRLNGGEARMMPHAQPNLDLSLRLPR